MDVVQRFVLPSLSIYAASTHTHIHTHIQEGKTNLDLVEQEIVSGSGISCKICKSAP